MPKIIPISANKLKKVFENVGFKCIRIEGDHYVCPKPGATRVIPEKVFCPKKVSKWKV